MKTIKLDLSNPEYNEQFSSNDLWQNQAASTLVTYLSRIGKQAREYKLTPSNRDESQMIHHAHDAILVSGSRGTGKSVFLKNAKTIWKKYTNPSDTDEPKLYFSPPIDPTLLQDHDSFTNVIVAHLYNQVVKALNVCSCQLLTASEQETQKQQFYDALRKLAEAIEQPGDKSERSGLDKIIQYSSGVRIEALFHKFISVAIKILDCDAIVLPIDDVDMALNQAYPVLEEIRRRLSCPYIIPLVSGDVELYSHLINIELSKNLQKKSHDANNKEDNITRELADAYLTKVLPHHYRIALRPIADLLSQLEIVDHNKQSISYDDYHKKLKQHFFGSLNGEEKSADYPQPESAREVGQLVRLLPPSMCIQIEKTAQRYSNWSQDWEAMRIWSEAKRHGASYVLARSATQQLIASAPFRLNHLAAFNIKQQSAERLPWAEYDFINEQITSLEKFPSSGQDEEINKDLLSNVIDALILRSMPPLELFTNRMSITDEQAKLESYPKMLDIYTLRTYYSSQSNQQRKVYFSRAFELLGTSLLMAVSQLHISINTEQGDNDTKWLKIFDDILTAPPFYSVHALNPTKPVNEQTDSDIPIDIVKQEEPNSSELANEIITWVKNNTVVVNDYLKNQAHVITLLSAVFNKTFSQLDLLRRKYGDEKTQNDQLLDAMLRFRYILINAFGFFIKENGSVAANLALNTKQETLRDEKSFASSTTYSNNVRWIEALTAPINEKEDKLHFGEQSTDKSDVEEDTTERRGASFLLALTKHPIFVEFNKDFSTIVSAKITSMSPPKTGVVD